VGCGVTFFPFAVARLGCRVTCTDTDPICARDIRRAAGVVPQAPGNVSFRPADEYSMPFADGELDAVYCISVMEHVPDPDRFATEIARTLRKGGRLFVTIDLDLRGDQSIGVKDFYRLVRLFEKYFVQVLPETTVHPRDVLTSASGQYAVRPSGVLGTSYGLLRGRCRFRDVVAAMTRRPPYHLACGGWVLDRR
jgi:2-polyprenyl-6-hydroxyphenyl methylase/3-demethylubiquinone-9 3-methyltransferase